ncbi:hypothetical protein GF325_17835 [Candidatus Bathyarchaeota archaeon]|nr:hypothetical protein [Candidatus Bathyarchaeota archaeon]
MASKRLMQLKFIANIFQYSLKEIKETLGFEALTMIFRRVGESVGEQIVGRFKGKYESIEEFCKLMIEHVISPVVGEDAVRCDISGNTLTFTLDACPYKKAGFPIKDMSFFCHYTEGMLDTAIKEAFPGKEFAMDLPDQLISKEGCDTCVFKVTQS